jgi:hypothetical protein
MLFPLRFRGDAMLLMVFGFVALATQGQDKVWVPTGQFAVRCPADTKWCKPVAFSMGKHRPKFVKSTTEGQVLITRFVLEGSSADEWTEALEVLQYPKKSSPPTSSDMFEQLKALRSRECSSTTYEMFEQTKESMLWESRSTGCHAPFPDQHAITRLIYGKSQVTTLIFTIAGKMQPETRDEWTKLLAQAKSSK